MARRATGYRVVTVDGGLLAEAGSTTTGEVTGEFPQSGGGGVVAANVVKLVTGRYSVLSYQFGTPGEGSVYGDTLGQGAAYPIVFDSSKTLDRVSLEVTTLAASAKVRLAIWANSSGLPGALLLDAGQIDAATTGEKSITISQPVVAGTVYWFSATTQGATGARVRVSQPGASPEMPATALGSGTFYSAYGVTFTGETGAHSATAPGTLPAAIGSTTGFNAIPRMIVRAA